MIELRNIKYSAADYQGKKIPILSNISLRIDRGHRLGIMGGNGSGKSTLLKLIAGLVRPHSGEIFIDGQSAGESCFQKNLGKKTGFMFQNPDHQIISVNVERELALSLENYGVVPEEMHRIVSRYLENFGLEKIRRSGTARLSGGEKQRLALAGVMILEPEIILFDEPTSHLDRAGRRIFNEDLKRLCENKNMTVLYATQNVNELPEFEEIIILDRGSVAEIISPENLISEPDKAAVYKIRIPFELCYKNTDVSVLRKKHEDLKCGSEDTRKNSPITLSCRNLNFGWRGGEKIIEDLSMDLYRGCVYGILGKTGCGKSSLAMLLAGLVRPKSGEIILDDKNASGDDLVKSVIYIFQNPERGFFAQNVYEDIAYGPVNYGYYGNELESMVKNAMNDCGLDFELFKDRSPFSLSGGEARLGAIAGGLAAGKDIIIMDEPAEELDLEGYRRIIVLIKGLAESGKTIVLISHNSDFIFESCDYVGLWSGKRPELFPKFDLYQTPGKFEEAGADIPGIVNFARKYDLANLFQTKRIDNITC